jgi:hypothetical protein
MDTHHQFRTGRGMAPALITIDDPAQEFHFAAGSVFGQPFDAIDVAACAGEVGDRCPDYLPRRHPHVQRRRRDSAGVFRSR